MIGLSVFSTKNRDAVKRMQALHRDLIQNDTMYQTIFSNGDADKIEKYLYKKLSNEV